MITSSALSFSLIYCIKIVASLERSRPFFVSGQSRDREEKKEQCDTQVSVPLTGL